MDFQTLLVCILVVLISTAVVYLTSVLGIKEKTYEEALEEKRKCLDLDAVTKLSKSKFKKDKKEKKKEKKQEKLEEMHPVKEDAFPKLTKPSLPREDFKFKHLDLTPSKPPSDEKEITLEKVEKVDESKQKSSKDECLDTESTSVELSSKSQVFESQTEKDITLSKKPKKQKPLQTSAVNLNENTSKKLLENIAACPLTNEEIQLIINSLLNKQVEEMNEWQKKHDPVNILKETLHEKEQEIQIHLQNLLAARRRIKELRLELEQERSLHSVNKEKISNMQKEFTAFRNSLQQAHEQQRLDIKALQTKLKEMQSELQGRNVLIQNMQEENTRLNIALQQFEAQRGSLERLPHLQHELEQLRAERGQFERRQSTLQQTNEELHRQVKQVDEKLKSLTNTKQNDEYSFQKRMKEMQDKLRQVEASKSSLIEDLKNKMDKCDQLEKERKVYEDELNLINKKSNEIIQQRDMLEDTVKSMHEVKKDNDMIRKELDKVSAELTLSLNKLEKEQTKVQELNSFKMEMEKKIIEEKKKCEEIEAATKKEFENIMFQQKQVNDEMSDKIKNDLKLAEKAKIILESKLKEYENERLKLRDILKQVVSNEDIKTDNDLYNQIGNIVSEVNIIRNNLQTLANMSEINPEDWDKMTQGEANVNNYEDILINSKQLLEEVGNKIKVEILKWQNKCDHIKNENKSLNKKMDQIESEKLLLQQSMAPISNLKDQVHEMEAKLKELQSKLEFEEKEKKNLETKYDENKTLLTTLHEELSNKNNEMGQLINEVEKIDEMTKEMEQIKEELEKEKKKSKDFKSQIVKMTSMVQFGQDALKAESNRVKELEELLNIKNGTASNITNGSTDSSNSKEVQEEAPAN